MSVKHPRHIYIYIYHMLISIGDSCVRQKRVPKKSIGYSILCVRYRLADTQVRLGLSSIDSLFIGVSASVILDRVLFVNRLLLLGCDCVKGSSFYWSSLVVENLYFLKLGSKQALGLI